MELLRELKQRLFNGTKSGSMPDETSDDDLGSLSELTDRLARMRGDNVTLSSGPGNFAPNRDGVKNLTAAARDALIINFSAEDRVLSDITEYRSLNRRRH